MKQIKRGVVVVIGIAFLGLGVVGLALPFLQGILFIAIGLLLVSLASPRLRKLLASYTERHPKIHNMIARVETWVRSKIGALD